MSYILNIETSTTNCSVSLFKGSKLVSFKQENDQNYSHSKRLHVFINNLLEDSKVSPKELSAISVSKGPGSYTGLRIGVSSAKGLCFALGIPLISVDTLDAFAHQIEPSDGFIVPLIDARRMEVYSSVYDNNFNKIRETKAEVLSESSFEKYLKTKKVYFLGNANDKTKSIIKDSNAIFIDDKLPSSIEIGKLAYVKFTSNDFENIANFEPFYLKEFIGNKLKSNQ
ncbi:tRNA (adenosine(37)-N6)-threonylcarbamoyltransferase complex dimerization subunit type 1 TsaB [Flavobacteriaceae bacterium]|nr:tRNA (adenosine(37)-N6)-threonylcarbamoyltransferase complex dimerization subunit type 1 TsaB [Flavobacteriaceae bacterium]MDC1492820.1 tRNA (adenosine(37)-N6)-threonylcarbamoyltransferase complex dimerization subunit type 1 TsaB [Flavobacteriaceae bacterium]